MRMHQWKFVSFIYFFAKTSYPLNHIPNIILFKTELSIMYYYTRSANASNPSCTNRNSI